MMRHRLAALALTLLPIPTAAAAEAIQTCVFPTLPHLVMRFPGDLNTEKTMAAGDRPAVPMTEGQGMGRVAWAEIDGYLFEFTPSNSVLQVSRDDTMIGVEIGTCVVVGRPERSEPLSLAFPADDAPVDAAAPAPAPTGDTGDWSVSSSTSAFDDSKTVVLSLASIDPIRGRFGGARPGTIYLRCMENVTVAYLVLNDLFLSDTQRYGVVEYRIDRRTPASARMAASTDNKALGLWSGNQSIPFIKDLMTGKRLVMRATPFNESPVEVAFQLAGLAEAVRPLRSACRW